MHPGLPPVFEIGLRYSFTYRAQVFEVPGKGAYPEKFTAGAFDRATGTIVPLKLEDRPVGHVRVLAADVADDGASVQFTYEIIDLEPS